jgi:hypothetical protein
MMAEKEDWTAPWAEKILRRKDSVASVKIVAPGRLEIERHGLPPVVIATLAETPLDHVMLAEVLAQQPPPDFVVNLSSGPSLTTEALLMSIDEQVPVGRMGDLARALSMPDIREYLDPETKFRERGLKQHSRVLDFKRLDLQRYRLERSGLSPLTVIFLNDYDLAAEAIRQARDVYGNFDIVVASNPYGRVTDSATEVAKQLGCEIHGWGAFLSRLNYEHNKK